MAVEFRLLGDVEAYVDGHRVDLGHARQRCVLVALLMDANRTVSVERLVERTWGEHRPHRPEATLRSYLSRLRQVLAPAGGEMSLARRPAGYALAVDESAVDVHLFRRRVAQARATSAEHDALALFRQALELWRGEAFGALDSAWLSEMRDTLAVERLAAEFDRTDLELRHGEPGELLAAMIVRATVHPLDERLAGQIMLAMYRTGRSAEALRHYHQIRDRLADELGVDPSAPLQRLYEQILTADPALAAGPASPVPRQLPGAIPYFVGRARELDLLTAQLDRRGPVLITSIGGTAGVGKTALAVHWARMVSDRFPDGQLYLNLRGFNPSGPPVTVAEAVRGFLDALGVPAARMPVDLDAQLALYRSTVHGRRMLIMLDDAASSDQVRPLLPGAPHCLVVVTSRLRLPSLIVRDHAKHLSLDLMSQDEARELLGVLLGAQRVDPDAVDELIGLCARLPLALGIVAARALTQPDLALRQLVAQLREERYRLAALSTGDGDDTDLRAVFSWSYRKLSAGAARTFRLLGMHPGPDIGLAAASSLAGQSTVDMSTGALAELVRAHLLVQHADDRYQLHDLLSLYARDLCSGENDADDALGRVLDHYLHTAFAAARLLQPFQDPIPMPAIRSGVTTGELVDHESALAWFDAELPVLRATLARASERGFDGHVWRLAWAMKNYLDRRGLWADQAAAHETAVVSARRAADQLGLAHAHRGLGLAYARMSRHIDAKTELLVALEQFESQDDHTGRGHTHLDLGWLEQRQGRRNDAVHHSLRALDMFHISGHRAGQANARNGIGWCHAMWGDYEKALRYCQEALAQFQEIGDAHGEAPTWDSIGYAHHHLGRYQEAIASYEQSLRLYRKLGNRYYEADILSHLGDTHAADSTPDAARAAWQAALAILTELDHPDAQDVRAKLDQLTMAT